MQRDITHQLHYLDDFIFVTASKEEASNQIDTLILICSQKGVPLKMSKPEGPSTCLTFLGIEVVTVAYQLHLPAMKLIQLKQQLTRCLCHKVGGTGKSCNLPPKLFTKVRAFSASYMLCNPLELIPTTIFIYNLQPEHTLHGNTYLLIIQCNSISMLYDS